MKFLKLFAVAISFIAASLLFTSNAFAESLGDSEAIQVIIDMFNDSGSAANKVGIGIIILSGLMTLLKWERLGKLFDMVPKQYRSFIPVILGSLIGVLQAIAQGDAGMGVLLTEFLKGGLLIGGLQQALYQQLKGTQLGGLLKTIVKT